MVHALTAQLLGPICTYLNGVHHYCSQTWWSQLPSELELTWWRIEGRKTAPRSWQLHPLLRTQAPELWRSCWRMKTTAVEVPPAGLRLASASSKALRCLRGVSWSFSQALRLKSIYAWSPSGSRRRIRSESIDDSRSCRNVRRHTPSDGGHTLLDWPIS